MALKDALCKVGYGAVFIVAWPALLTLLATRLDVALPLWVVPLDREFGAGMALIGGWLMLHGMYLLAAEGGGLPMNAFPPPRLVRMSLYAVIPHPIYAGFSLCVAGVSIWAGSPAGFWIVAPLSALCSLALVLGYEGPSLRRRFDASPRPLLGLPPALDEPVGLDRAMGAGIISLGLWVALYILFAATPGPAQGIDWRMGWERSLPLPGWTLWVYSLAYPFAAAIPFLARTLRELRRDVLAVWAITATGFFVMFLLPGRVEMVDPTGGPDWLLKWNRACDADWQALPAFHAAWAILAASIWARRFGKPLVFQSIAAAICLSCITVGSHGVVDVLTGVALGGLAARLDTLWSTLLALTTKAANSWRSIRVGPVRIISHATWSALAAATGVYVSLAWTAPGDGPWLILVCLGGLVAAGVWGYLLEGGTRLSRPFGYFGYLFGAALGVGTVALFRPEVAMRLAAGLAVAAPLTQAIGRMRCLVQGCCHGSACEGRGVVVTNPMSRVVSLAALRDVPIHPTQLYSLLLGLVLFLIQVWLSRAHPSWGLLVGTYLILSSLFRFMEEAYRGEPQTAVVAGLSIYQWLGAGVFLAGVAFLITTPLSADLTLRVPGRLEAEWAFAYGLLAAAAMSMDMPETGWRFSCLTVQRVDTDES